MELAAVQCTDDVNELKSSLFAGCRQRHQVRFSMHRTGLVTHLVLIQC